MTTVSAFNEMMGQFLGELVQTFPDEPALKEALDKPRDRSTLDNFMKDMTPWANQMMAKSDEFFTDQNEFAKKLALDSIWKKEECTENTKNAIWQYLQTMYMLATTINMFPPETLTMIESAAETCAKNMQAGGGALDDGRLLQLRKQAAAKRLMAQVLGQLACTHHNARVRIHLHREKDIRPTSNQQPTALEATHKP
jgi:hypothetical protein